MKDKKALYLCQCFSSTYLFNQREQTKSDDSSWILHASAQAYRRRTDYRSLQPSTERIIHLDIEHLDEMGDLCRKKLIIEIMGKHSNIIFCDLNGRIIDSIKHVSAQMSSVREVLPGRDYFIPDTMSKKNPMTATQEEFISAILAKPMTISKAIYSSMTGISPVIARRDLLSCRCGLFHDGA